MFCSNCGQKVPDDAKFCFACGAKLFSVPNTIKEQETISQPVSQNLTESKDAPIEFQIRGHILRFDPSYREYTSKRSAFFAEVLMYLNNAIATTQQKLNAATNCDEAIMEITNFGDNAINQCIEQGYKFLLSNNVYDVSKDQLIVECRNAIADGDYAKAYGEFEEGCLAIVATEEQMQKYRQLKKENRGYWQGGGFGVKGAIKGAITAGAMNAVGDVFHGIGDFIATGFDESKINKKKQELLKKKNWLGQSYKGVVSDINTIFECVYRVYTRDKHINMPPVNSAKKLVYFKNAMAVKEDKEEFLKLMLMTLQEYPYARVDYLTLLKFFKGLDSEVLQMMEFFLPAPFLNWFATIIHIGVVKHLLSLPEDTYEEIDQKIALLKQIEKSVTGQASESTVCAVYVKKFYQKDIEEMCQALTKKRLTADDGEQFDSVEELNQYILDRPKFEEYKGESLKVKEYADKISLLKQYSVSVQSPRVKQFFESEEKNINLWRSSEDTIKAAVQRIIDDQDQMGALSVLTDLAEKGVPEAQFWCGRCEEDKSDAAEWYQKAAEQGYIEAQRWLGNMYYSGELGEHDYSSALKYYTMAAEQGDASSQEMLGRMYRDGTGVVQNYIQAMEWYQKAAAQGEVIAQRAIGHLYREGEGVSKDYQEAVAWFKKAAAQGDKDSQMMLGIVWSDGGFGIEQDYNEAFTWYQKAAEQGDIHSQMNIGYMYEKGLGVEQDYEMAAKWYTQAAEKGNATAQNNLALLYEHGKGVPKNHKKAIELLYCAIENGSSSAEGNLKAIKKFWE